MPNSVFRLAVILACAAGLAACTKPAAGPAASTAAAATTPTAGYIAPPELKAAQHSAAGGVELKGVSRPDALIRMVSSDGTGLTATADHAGAWEMRAPAVDPRLYALAEVVGGRPVRSRGYVLILPPPGIAAVILRPGAGLRAIGGPRAEPVITAVDYDSGKAGVVSGLAGPGQPVRAQVDGVEVGETRADAGGGFSISLPDTLKAGAHVAVVRALTAKGPSAPAQASFEVGPPPAGFVPPLSAQRLDGGWRLDWLTPGGGLQTTFAFDTEPRT